MGNNSKLHKYPVTRSKRFQAVGSTYGLPLPFKCRVACLMRSVSLLWSLREGAPPLQGGGYVAFKAPLRRARSTFDWRASACLPHMLAEPLGYPNPWLRYPHTETGQRSVDEWGYHRMGNEGYKVWLFTGIAYYHTQIWSGIATDVSCRLAC